MSLVETDRIKRGIDEVVNKSISRLGVIGYLVIYSFYSNGAKSRL